MSKITAASVKVEYVNKSGRTVKGVKVVEGQYPWSIYSQECLRILAAYKTLGPDGFVTLLDSFVKGTQYEPTAVFEYSEYQGHSLIKFKADANDKRALSFGAGKAKAILALIEGLGMRAFIGLVTEVAGDAEVSQSSGKGKKSGTKGGGKGRPKAEVEESDEDESLPAPTPKVEVAAPKSLATPAPTSRADDMAELIEEQQSLLMRLYVVNSKLANLAVSV